MPDDIDLHNQRSSLSVFTDEVIKDSTYNNGRNSVVNNSNIYVNNDINAYVTPLQNSELFALTELSLDNRSISEPSSICTPNTHHNKRYSILVINNSNKKHINNDNNNNKSMYASDDNTMLHTDSIAINVSSDQHNSNNNSRNTSRRSSVNHHNNHNNHTINHTTGTLTKRNSLSIQSNSDGIVTSNTQLVSGLTDTKRHNVNSLPHTRNQSIVTSAKPLTLKRFGTSISLNNNNTLHKDSLTSTLPYPTSSNDITQSIDVSPGLPPVSPSNKLLRFSSSNHNTLNGYNNSNRNTHSNGLLFHRGATFKNINALTLHKQSSNRSLNSSDDCELPPLKTTQTLKKHSRWLIYPNSQYRNVWNVCCVLCILYNAVEVPMNIAFTYEQSGGLLAMDIIIDLFFVADLILNFLTAYYDERLNLITSYKQISRRYFRSWFVIDLLGSVPIDLITIGMSDNDRTLYVFGALKLPRLFRIARLVNLLHTRTHHILSEVIRMIKLIMAMYITSHWIACGFYLIGRLEETGSLHSLPAIGNSISLSTTNNLKSWISNVYDTNSTISQQYVYSLYWSFTVLATVGFGDIVPITLAEMLYTVCVMIVGAIMYAAIVGNVMLVLNNLNAQSQQHTSAILKFANYMRYRGFPTDLRKRVLDYVEAEWQRNRGHDENMMLHTLPLALQTDISRHLHGKLIEQVGWLNESEVGFINAVALALKDTILLPNILVTRKGQPGQCMYFIVSGSIELIDTGQVYAVLTAGQYVGESALLDGLYRQTARTATYCELCVLSRSEFERIAENYPQFVDIIQKQCEATMKMEQKKHKLKQLFSE